VAFRHPILDRKFGVTSDAQAFTNSEIEELIQCYIHAAKLAWDVGADFVDIKHCHGYLAARIPRRAHTARQIRWRLRKPDTDSARNHFGIRASGNKIEIGVRLSAFDFVPFKPDPALSQPGKPGPGIPEDFSHCLPYRYGFGVNAANPVEYDLTETFQFVELCARLGVKILNLSAGSPYYNPHIQRPAAYPPSDGYQPPEDPLVGVARQIGVVRQVKDHCSRRREEADAADIGESASLPRRLPILVGTAYSYLQEYLPHVAQYVVRHGWADMIGIGRMVLSYPDILTDAVEKGTLQSRVICRTFSDCTTAPRNGMISGCYPLDKYYSAKPEFQQLKKIKKKLGREDLVGNAYQPTPFSKSSATPTQLVGREEFGLKTGPRLQPDKRCKTPGYSAIA